MDDNHQLDIQKFFKATNPDLPLFADNVLEDKNYYIDFSSVRGGKVIEKIEKTITFLSPDQSTCQLFTGHIGCGKSTELLKLKTELEEKGFHVVYVDSYKYLNMDDVDVSDILLMKIREYKR